jgi:hypothetical protein
MFKDKRILILILVLSLVFPVFSIVRRFSLERENSGVEIIIDSDDFQSLAYQEGITFYELLKHLRSAGATTLSVPYLNWQDLETYTLWQYRPFGICTLQAG